MKTPLTAIAALCILASTSMAVPVSDSIPFAQNIMGSSTCRPPNSVSYTISYDSVFGGHWDLSGKRKNNRDGTYTDKFTGTVSDTSVTATLSPGDFGWTSDSSYLCNHVYLVCISFSMTITDGHITGFATYSP